jgi:hypothetical protein
LAYLIFHKHLLKSWTDHCLFPGLLTPRPHTFPVWRLRFTHLLRFSYGLGRGAIVGA